MATNRDPFTGSIVYSLGPATERSTPSLHGSVKLAAPGLLNPLLDLDLNHVNGLAPERTEQEWHLVDLDLDVLASHPNPALNPTPGGENHSRAVSSSCQSPPGLNWENWAW